MTGHGGWPMTVFLTPDGAPFYGGTYFPPDDRHGMPSFRRVLTAVGEAYRRKPRRSAAHGRAAARSLRRSTTADAPAERAQPRPRSSARIARWPRVTTRSNGGFGGAPKFPQTMALEFLLSTLGARGAAARSRMVERFASRRWRAAASTTSSAAAFARYSVDASWLVPHFEKMLYDNALLVAARRAPLAGDGRCRVRARRRGDARLGRCARCASPDGGFYSRSTRTARATKASSTSGRVERSTRCSAPMAASCGRTGASRAAATSRARTFSRSPPPPLAALARSIGVGDARDVDRPARQVALLRPRVEARVAGPRRQDSRVVERAHGARVRGSGACVRRRRLSRRGGRRRRVSVRAPRARRSRDAIVLRRPRTHRRLPRGSRVGRASPRSPCTS